MLGKASYLDSVEKELATVKKEVSAMLNTSRTTLTTCMRVVVLLVGNGREVAVCHARRGVQSADR